MPSVSPISAPDFVREVREDFNSPTTSNFVNRIPQCKETVAKLEETLYSDKEGLVKLKNAVKDMRKAGNDHVASEEDFSKALHRLGESAIERMEEPDEIGAAFKNFAVVTKEMANLMKNMMQNLDSIILFPVDRLLKTDFRGSKGDMKRPFDRSWKEYQDKYNELERQKKKLAKENGLHRSEITAGEIADELDKERKYLQLTTADYLVRMNEIRTKKGVNLLQQMLEYYKSQLKYFSEGLKMVEHFGGYVEDLSSKLVHIASDQEKERSELISISNTLKNSPGFNKVQNGSSTIGHTYSLHQAKGDVNAGNRKSGFLNKRSEGRLRNVWQRRKCEVREGLLNICHADESKQPTKVNLLTCQMKPVADDRLCFDVVSYNRTYHFQSENEADKEAWMSVLLNSKDGALTQAFAETGTTSAKGANGGYAELQRALVAYIRNLPSNDKCCDCGSNNDATWLSTNFGVIICIECSGIHREMGVHVSKIQSLTLDNIGTSQLLVSRVMTNDAFNKVMEATAGNANGNGKIKPTSTMAERKAYIKAKYEERQFLRPLCNNQHELFNDLEAAIDTHSIYDLLQSVEEAPLHGVDVTDPLPTSEFAETSLHYAISRENNGNSLHIVDFLVQNSTNLDKQTREGNTPLHYCVIQNQCESMRLLLRSGANPCVENNNGKTPIDISKERGHHLCEEMLMHAVNRKKGIFENVNIDWHLSHDEGYTDFSDDETLDDHRLTLNGSHGGATPNGRHSHHHSHTLHSPDKAGSYLFGGQRPMSVYTPNSKAAAASAHKSTEWLATTDGNWARSTPSTDSQGDSPESYRTGSNMPPPPPPTSGKKPSIFSTSNLTGHMIGSLKKGSKQSLSLPSTAYNTLPSQHHLRTTTSSPRFIQQGPSSSHSASHHKRSPSSDSGHGTMHNTAPAPTAASVSSGPASGGGGSGFAANVRSTTPVSYHGSTGAGGGGGGGRRSNNTVYLHVNSRDTGSMSTTSDTSPPLKFSAAEESSPENRPSPMMTPHRLRNGQSTESLDSLSDESGNHFKHNRSGGGGRNRSHHNTPAGSGVNAQNPVARPRRRNDPTPHVRRCRALYDCDADNDDELSFEEGDVIVILNEETEDENWMEGYLESKANKRGLFPVSFVEVLAD